MTTNQNKGPPRMDREMPDVIKYLLGEGPLDGLHFPDFPDNGEKLKRRYWWRKHLREAWQNREALTLAQSAGEEAWRYDLENAPARSLIIVANVGGSWPATLTSGKEGDGFYALDPEANPAKIGGPVAWKHMGHPRDKAALTKPASLSSGPGVEEFTLEMSMKLLEEHGGSFSVMKYLWGLQRPSPAIPASVIEKNYRQMLDTIKAIREAGKVELVPEVGQHIERWEEALTPYRSKS